MASKRALPIDLYKEASKILSPGSKRRRHLPDPRTLQKSDAVNAINANSEPAKSNGPSIITSDNPPKTSSPPRSAEIKALDAWDGVTVSKKKPRAQKTVDSDSTSSSDTSSSSDGGDDYDSEEGPALQYDENGGVCNPSDEEDETSSSEEEEEAESDLESESDDESDDAEPDQQEEITTLPIPSKPVISRQNLPGPGSLEDRLKNFLPALQQANFTLDEDMDGTRSRPDEDDDGETEAEEGGVEMDLALGVLEEKGQADGEIQIRDLDAGDGGVGEDGGQGFGGAESVLDRLLGKRGGGSKGPEIEEV